MKAKVLPASAYLGLFAALLSSLACNVFLDIQYGDISREMAFWTVVMAWTLLLGWRQGKKATAGGKVWQKGVLLFGLFLFFFVFMRVWGMPRAGLYLLAMLQASYNCVTRERRQLNLGLLVSLALVLFATSHYRADWTLLFYLVPYVIAVVFTVVADQIDRRDEDLRKLSLGEGSTRGQGAAALAATAAILSLGGALYLLTPQVNWPYLEWRYGQLVPADPGGALEYGGSSGRNRAGTAPDAGSSAENQSVPPGGSGLSPASRWPTPTEMRAAAKRPNMPRWQAKSIERLADATALVQQVLQPVAMDLWEALKHWLKDHWLAILMGLLALLSVAISIAFWVLFRELPWMAWLLMQWDYFSLGILSSHAQGQCGACQYYRAMTRLFTVLDQPRASTVNAREYLSQIGRLNRNLYPHAAEMTQLFEQARYGTVPVAAADLERMRQLYRELYQRV